MVRLLVDPPSSLPVARFVNLVSEATRLGVVFPVDPVKVRSVKFLPFAELPQWMRESLARSPDVLGFTGLQGETLYTRLDDMRRAGLLNAVTGRPTHPYDIHEILVRYQQLDPGYRFVLA